MKWTWNGVVSAGLSQVPKPLEGISKNPTELNPQGIHPTHPPTLSEFDRYRRSLLDVFVARGDTNVVRPCRPPAKGLVFWKVMGKRKVVLLSVRHTKWKSQMENSIERILPKVFLEVVFYFVISVDKMGRLAWGYITHGNGRLRSLVRRWTPTRSR